MSQTETDSSLELGTTALQRGDWAVARRIFESLVGASPTAAALEGLAEAAWWQDDAETMFSARERAFQLFRDAGDRQGAARMALWLGTDYLDFRGDSAISSGWRQLARRLLDDLPTSAEHGWFAAFEADIQLLLEEDTEQARISAEEAIAIGRRLGIPDIEVIGTTIEGLAYVIEGKVRDGMLRLDAAAAAALAGELREAFSINMVLCHLIYACEQARDFSRAAQWCQRARECADRMGFAFGQGICRVHYAGVLIWRGRWQEAERELAEARRYLTGSHPPYEAEARVRLAELRRRQGRADEAGNLFREVDWHPLAALGLAELALESRAPQDAEEYVQRVLRQLPEKSVTSRESALELLVRIQLADGRPEDARRTYEQVSAIAEAIATQPLLAAARFLSGVISQAAGELDEARDSFEDATWQFERCGAPYEAARARLSHAVVLHELGRLKRAKEEASVALRAFHALGAEREAARAQGLLEDRDARATEPLVLTWRQTEVLKLIAQGLGDREIAAVLIMSEHTVHRHVANILLRLGLSSRAAAVAQAARLGLL